jgi:hypothetical protein
LNSGKIHKTKLTHVGQSTLPGALNELECSSILKNKIIEELIKLNNRKKE